LAPVTFKIRINRKQTLGSLYKGKTDMHAVFLHGFNPLPVYFTLRVGYINTMDMIFGRDADLETFIGAVVRVFAYILKPLPGGRK
jgi:hypothetical protein